MRPNPQEQQALVGLLTKLYHEIRGLEAQWSVMGREGDFRPRIEYFHDAVRALTSGSGDPYAKGGRLSVEYLAYDIQMLRHIESMPLAGISARGQNLSPKTELVVAGTPGSKGGRPDRETRAQLSELYKGYGVFFAALFCEAADKNHQSRTEDLNEQVADLALVEKLLAQLEQGKPVQRELEAVLDQVTDDRLRDKLTALINKRQKKREELQGARTEVKGRMKDCDKQIAVIEKAHFTYVTSQLAVYENAKDTVKKLAGQGMNLAGNFVAGAMSEAMRGGARGR